VEAGQVLARLDDAAERDKVAQAEINLRQAELNLAALTDGVDPADLAAAQANLLAAKATLAKLTAPPTEQEMLAAQANLRGAQETLADLLAGHDEDRLEAAQAELTLAEIKVQQAQAAYDKVASREDVGATQQAMDLWQATTNYEKALGEYNEVLQGPSAGDIADARSRVALAQAQLDALLTGPDPEELAAAEAKATQAQAQLDELLSGASSRELEMAQLNLEQARLNLESAQRAVDETILVAPTAGTVLAVTAEAGEAIGTGAIITLADLSAPRIQFWVEEADMSSVAVGNAVNIVFEALPDYTFPGEIVSIDPMLVTVDGTPAIQSYASVDLTGQPIGLLSGMNAEVEVVAGEARNALLVPLQALREIAADQYAVFVVQPDDQMEMRLVEVGLRDFVNAEILSGLKQGEVISLGQGAGSSSVGEAPADEQAPPPGSLMRIFGGGG